MMNGHVYLLHFSIPLGDPTRRHAWASHYIGWALSVEERLADHLAGKGAAITRAAVERGIPFTVVRTWQGTRELERLLKSFKRGPQFCPTCCRDYGWRCRDLPAATQLALPLDDDTDLPDLPPLPTEMDPYECFMLGRFRAARGVRFELGDTTSWDIQF